MTTEWFAAYLFNIILICFHWLTFISFNTWLCLSLFFLLLFSFAHDVAQQSDFLCKHRRQKISPLTSHNLLALIATGLAFIFIFFDSVEVFLTISSPIPSCFPYFYFFKFSYSLLTFFSLLPPMNNSGFLRNWCFLCIGFYWQFYSGISVLLIS